MKKWIVVLTLAALAAVAIPGAVAADGVSATVEAPCAGWHMLSVPIIPDNPAATVVFAGAVAVYEWDAVAKTYRYNPTIDPCKGYWVAVTEPTTFTVTGQPYTG